jgi:hypothetical protein
LSTIRVDNFGPSAGGTTYSARGIAKAWVNFNGTGTIAARDSENVSSLTDNGTGDYSANLSSSMANTNGAVTTSGHQAALPGGRGYNIDASFNTVSSIRMAAYLPNTLALIDTAVVQISGMGDLA